MNARSQTSCRPEPTTIRLSLTTRLFLAGRTIGTRARIGGPVWRRWFDRRWHADRRDALKSDVSSSFQLGRSLAVTPETQSSIPKRVLVFSSPKAGSGAGRDEIPKLVERLRGESIPCQCIDSVDELRDVLTNEGRGLETIVVTAGGDGTLSLAASIVGEQDLPRTTLLPMPMGTENLLAREYGYSHRAEEVLDTILHGQNRKIDAGLANGKLFLIMATCGFDAEVVRRMHLARRGHIRRISYLLPIFHAMKGYSFPALRVTVDGEQPFECGWAMVFNLPQYGGMLKIEKDAVDDDGLFDVIAFQRRSILSGLWYVAQVWIGRHRHDPSVMRLQGKSIRIEADEAVPFQLDGDFAGESPVEIEMVARGVTLRAKVGNLDR